MSTFPDFDELCEDIWYSKDIQAAAEVMEIYSKELSPYGFELLCEVIFGPEKITLYEKEKISLYEKIQIGIDYFLKRFI